MIHELQTKWVCEMAAQPDNFGVLPPKIAELAEVIGAAAAIKAYIFYSPVQTTFPEREISELKKIYIRKKFGEYSALELAKILGVSLPFVYSVINGPTAPRLEQIKIFD